MQTTLEPCTSYAGAKIGEIPSEDRPRIAQIVKSYNNTLKVSQEDMRWLMRLFIEKVRVTHMELDITCNTCRMKTLNCFIGYVDYWQRNGLI